MAHYGQNCTNRTGEAMLLLPTAMRMPDVVKREPARRLLRHAIASGQPVGGGSGAARSKASTFHTVLKKDFSNPDRVDIPVFIARDSSTPVVQRFLEK